VKTTKIELEYRKQWKYRSVLTDANK